MTRGAAIDQLVAALRAPATLAALPAEAWPSLLSVARAEALLGTLAHVSASQPLPPAIAALFAAERAATANAHRLVLAEARRCRSTLAAIGVQPVLLKGTAYVAAGLSAAQGRQVGDVDILVPRDRLDACEAALRGAGWEWLKPDPYDDSYYRRWMHELPPLLHRDRDRILDVHHTILPLTHRARPDAAALLTDAVVTKEGFHLLSPQDRIIHCAAHLIADGDLAGGLRNLWDMHCLLRDVVDWDGLAARAEHHQLWPELHRAMRLAMALYGTPIPKRYDNWDRQDKWYRQRLLARDDWGRETRGFVRFIFFIRSHWMRMPPLLLTRHLWTKWRRR